MNLATLAQLPDWPGRMTAPAAAAYMGVSETTFLKRYSAISRKEGGNTFWSKAQLDRVIAEQFGETPTVDSQDVYGQWKAGRPTVASRPAHRHQAKA